MTMTKDPTKVPEAISVKLGDLRFKLAESANTKGISLGEEIRRRLAESIERDQVDGAHATQSAPGDVDTVARALARAVRRGWFSSRAKFYTPAEIEQDVEEFAERNFERWRADAKAVLGQLSHATQSSPIEEPKP